MISIIICSRNKGMLAQITSNVEETIGVQHEIISVNNSTGKYGICAAYNLGASQSKYEILCFMHEDIKFHTLGWGQVVADKLADARAGVLGVAGGTYQPAAPTSWVGAGLANIRMNVLHSTNTTPAQLAYHNAHSETVAEAATVDGLWMCCRKDVWQEFPFDEINFPHFHFYDIDFCTRIFPKYKILITYEILIEHFSAGTFERDWLINAIKYYKLRRAYLPFGAIALTASEAKAIELNVFQQAAMKTIGYDLGLQEFVFACAKLCQ
ncbi:glycosyltransferase [Hymenobacter humi]|uniref:Glycosyltransferase n=1 Tax=Hymenobacter humi TaxID=1411620 RepID=A0ABW2UAK2_9BACT